ncbi:twin-arginine translocation signal domain-containing protein [bacterium]|nr:twin-arginine translocation signal domain-containing protein [bacterium]
MKKISRRSFIKTTASAAAVTIATPLLPRGLYGLARVDTTGYFENEFGITDSLCQKVLAEALSSGGDFADLFFEHTISSPRN